MYFLSSNCDYCNVHCSRDHGKPKDVPYMITPELPFIKEFVCQPCWDKLKGKLTKMVNDIMSNGETNEK